MRCTWSVPGGVLHEELQPAVYLSGDGGVGSITKLAVN